MAEQQQLYTLKAEINGATFDGVNFSKDTKKISGTIIEGSNEGSNEEPIKYQTSDGTTWLATKETRGGRKRHSYKKGGKKYKKNGKKSRRH